jgi:hypothetical protein
LPNRHAHGGKGIGGQEAKSHGRSRRLIANDSQPKQERRLLQAILNNNKQLQVGRGRAQPRANALFAKFFPNRNN